MGFPIMEKKRVVIPYATFSGNTEEIADIINDQLIRLGIDSHTYEMGHESYMIDPKDYDMILIGTFTWDIGMTPDDVKDFVADIGYKPDNIAIFGTGDTQFGGDDLFCKAVDRLAKFYGTKFDTLKIEQSPRGSQEVKVREWTEYIAEKALKIDITKELAV